MLIEPDIHINCLLYPFALARTNYIGTCSFNSFMADKQGCLVQTRKTYRIMTIVLQITKKKIGHKISSIKGLKKRCSKNNKQKKNRLEVAGYSIIDMEEIVIMIMTWDMGHEINSGDDDGNPTQVDALGVHRSRWSRKSRESQSQNSMKK